MKTFSSYCALYLLHFSQQFFEIFPMLSHSIDLLQFPWHFSSIVAFCLLQIFDTRVSSHVSLSVHKFHFAVFFFFKNFILLFSPFSFCEIHFFPYLRRMKFSFVYFLYISFVVWHTSFAHFGIIYKLLNRFCEWKNRVYCTHRRWEWHPIKWVQTVLK